MMTMSGSQKTILGLLTVAIFSFLANPIQTWDYSNYSNLNSIVLIQWGIAVLLSITLLFVKNHNRIPVPILWAVLGIVASITLLPFVDYPVSSLIATPVGNTGIIQNLSGVIIAYATYCFCRDNTKNQGIIVTITVLALITFTAIGVLYGKSDMPFGQAIRANIFASWGDVYALIALPSLIVITVGLYNPNQYIKYISVLGIIIVLFDVYISNSKSAQLLLLSSPIIYGFLYLFDKYGKKISVVKPYFIPMTIIALTTAIAISILWITNIANVDGWQTILERSLLTQVYLTAIENDFSRLLTGWGWGQNHDIQQLYSPLTSSQFETDIRVYHPTDPRATAAGGLGATSLHNILIDSLAAMGIFGGITLLGMLYTLGKTCKNHNLVFIAWIMLIGLYSVWFSTAVSIVPFFIAIGITCSLITSEKLNTCQHIESINTPIVQKIALVSSAILIAGGTFYFAKQTAILSKSYQKKQVASELYYNSFYNQDAVNYNQGRKLLRDLSAPGINDLIDGKTISTNQLRLIVDTIDVYVEKSENNNHTMTIELLNIINIIMVQGDEKNMEKARQRYYNMWVPTLKKTVELAPYRFDLWKPYMQFLYDYGQYKPMGDIAQYILSNGNPNDPTALFYRGLAYRALGDNVSANIDINNAIDAGVSSIIFNAKEFIQK